MRMIAPAAARRAIRPLLGGMVLGAVSCAGIGVLAATQRTENRAEQAQNATAATRARPAPARTAPVETAMSLPRPPSSAPGGKGIAAAGLPTVLPPSEASRLRRIFEFQAAGDFAAAARETERLE